MAVTNMRSKLLIDTENRKVLFAEADKDFIDFLFHILRLPLGTIIPLLKKQEMHKVDVSGGTGEVPLLLPDIESSSTSRKFYRCSRLQNNNCYRYVADDGSALCPSCQGSMTHDVSFVDPPTANNAVSSGGGVTLLNKFNVKQLGDLEEKVVELGIEEVLKLLKASLQSKSVLTDVFLPMLEREVNIES
uniref:Uncharacterized protein n=1 Tax=Quercus lobata TaxID=97700 RepID=A0A7N2ME73_QUELO